MTESGSESVAVELARINGETAKIAWHELQRFFAQGLALYVSPELDLVEVALQMSLDNQQQIEAWMAADALAQVSDAQASEWVGRDALMWTVVVRPWVLVQPLAVGQGS